MQSNQRKLLAVFRNFVVSVGSRERLGFGLVEALDMALFLARQLKVCVWPIVELCLWVSLRFAEILCLCVTVFVFLCCAVTPQLPNTTASKDDKKALLLAAKKGEGDGTDTVVSHARILAEKDNPCVVFLLTLLWVKLEFLTGSVLELLRAREADIAALLPDAKRAELCTFLFQSLYFTNPAACRKLAAEALGLLSRSHLDSVVVLFTRELSQCKDLKEYLTYQRAVHASCHFSLVRTCIFVRFVVVVFVETCCG